MRITEIIAEIQANPDNIQAYRHLIAHCKDCNRLEEAAAFEHLVEIKYGLNSSNSSQESTRTSSSND